MPITENLIVDSLILENAIQDTGDQAKQIPVLKSLKETAEKISALNPTITECRIPIFNPISKALETSDIVQEFKKNKGIRTINTSWGKAFVRGRVVLTQTHRDLLDCILLSADNASYSRIDGSMQVIFSARKALKIYNQKGANTLWLVSMMEQIRDTVIKLKKGRVQVDFNILRRIVYSEEQDSFYIEFDPTYMAFYQTEMVVCYKSIMPLIIDLKNGLIKAIIRFLVSHKQIIISLENLLMAIGCIVGEDQDRKLRRIIADITSHSNLLDEIGIVFDKKAKTFSYTQQKDIFISKPILSKERSTLSLEALSQKRKQSKSVNVDTKDTVQPTLFDISGIGDCV